MAKRRSKRAASSPRSPKRAPAKRAARAPATSPSPQQPTPLKPGEVRAGELLPGDPLRPVVIQRDGNGVPTLMQIVVGGEPVEFTPGRVRLQPGKEVRLWGSGSEVAAGLPARGVRIVRPIPQVGRAAAVGARRGHASQRADALDEARRLLAIVDGPEYRILRPKTLWGKVRALPEFEGRWKSGDSVRRAIDRARKMVAKADPDNG
jgi:hypothetical protein